MPFDKAFFESTVNDVRLLAENLVSMMDVASRNQNYVAIMTAMEQLQLSVDKQELLHHDAKLLEDTVEFIEFYSPDDHDSQDFLNLKRSLDHMKSTLDHYIPPKSTIALSTAKAQVSETPLSVKSVVGTQKKAETQILLQQLEIVRANVQSWNSKPKPDLIADPNRADENPYKPEAQIRGATQMLDDMNVTRTYSPETYQHSSRSPGSVMKPSDGALNAREVMRINVAEKYKSIVNAVIGQFGDAIESQDLLVAKTIIDDLKKSYGKPNAISEADLFTTRDVSDNTIFMMAAYNGDLAMLRMLTSECPRALLMPLLMMRNVDGDSIMTIAENSHDKEMLDLLTDLVDPARDNILSYALKSGNSKMVKDVVSTCSKEQLAKLLFHVNDNGDNILMLSFQDSKINLLKNLSEMKGYIDEVKEAFIQQNKQGNNILMLIVLNNNPELFLEVAKNLDSETLATSFQQKNADGKTLRVQMNSTMDPAWRDVLRDPVVQAALPKSVQTDARNKMAELGGSDSTTAQTTPSKSSK